MRIFGPFDFGPTQPFQPQNALPPGFHPGWPPGFSPLPHGIEAWLAPFVDLARIYQAEGWEKAEEWLERGPDA